MCREAAPVNDPFSWPNNSDSISSAGTAAQFSVTYGPAWRWLLSWIVRAISSLPVPVLTQDANTRLAGGHAIHLRQQLAHLLAGKNNAAAAQLLSQLLIFLLQAFQLQRVLYREQQLVGGDGFFQEVERAQPRAFTAISICAWPDIITTGVVTPAALICSSSASPFIAGMTTSEKITSNFSALIISRALIGLSQTVASCPARRKARRATPACWRHHRR